MSDWPHRKIYTVATWYIHKNSYPENDWLYTKTGTLHAALATIVDLDACELPVVSCYIDGHSWCVMTTARVIAKTDGAVTHTLPLEVDRWEWGDFKTGLKPEIGTARLQLRDRTSILIPYETGKASMAPIYYERFWCIKYPVLDILDTSLMSHRNAP